MFKRLWKNEKGLTLVELLAVVVILGIIAAIAVPSIGSIIDNTKRDAHLANAQQLVSSAKLYIATENPSATDLSSTGITLKNLIDNGYLSDIKDPSGTTGSTYNTENTKIFVEKDSTKGYQYYVILTNGTNTYIDGHTPATKIDITALTRSHVNLPGETS